MNFDLIARTSAILLTAWFVAALLRRAAPSTRHLVWHLAIVIVLLAPVLISLAPTITVPAIPGVPAVPKVLFQEVPGVTAVPTAAPTVELGSAGTIRYQALGTLGTIGTAGTIGLVGWFLFCWLLSGLSVWRGSRPAPEDWNNEARVICRRIGLKRLVAVRQSLKDGSPHVAGLFSSAVMMPPSAAEWTQDARQAALVHELTHIKRADRRTQAIAQLACALYWFNPLVWYAAAGLARERERACDDECCGLAPGHRPMRPCCSISRVSPNRCGHLQPRSAWPGDQPLKGGCSRFLPMPSACRGDRHGGWWVSASSRSRRPSSAHRRHGRA